MLLECKIGPSTMLLECKIGPSTTLLEYKIGPSKTILSFTRKNRDCKIYDGKSINVPCWNASYWIRLDQIGSAWIRLDQIGSDWMT